MKIEGAIVAVTGGGHGIGRALASEAARRGAKAVAVGDLDHAAAEAVAKEIGGKAYALDVSTDAGVAGFVQAVEQELGPIDIYISNAGVLFTDAPHWTAAGCSLEKWDAIWKINVMAHVFAARALLPGWMARKSGHMVITASAAGLLGQIGDAAYSTTKHAAVGYAESFAITHGDDGIGTTVLCPQAVQTQMVGDLSKANSAIADGILSPEQVAAETLDAVEANVFMVTPHAAAREYFRNKAADYDRWVGGMRKFRRILIEKNGGTPL